jgi:hypothetical protein
MPTADEVCRGAGTLDGAPQSVVLPDLVQDAVALNLPSFGPSKPEPSTESGYTTTCSQHTG